MITDQDYNQLSDRVYWLDPKHKRYTPSIKEGRIRKFGNLKFQILKIKRILRRMGCKRWLLCQT